MEQKLWKFTDNDSSFEARQADKIKSLYFPLCNDKIMSSVSPDLHGDIKTGQTSFLLAPVSRIDLVNLRASRNFWIYLTKDKVWSATGVSKDLNQLRSDEFRLSAGLLWHKITRSNKKIGLEARITSFVPYGDYPVEIMQVEITNISSRKVEFVPFAAIPIYARGANSIRDHRHVTSLLQRITIHRLGVLIKPTLLFDESGHKPNRDIYFVLGQDEKSNPPQYIYPTQEMFCGEDGDLEAPQSVLENKLPDNSRIQGREAIGALRFRKISLLPNKSHSYIILMGIVNDKNGLAGIIDKFNTIEKINKTLQDTKDAWISIGRRIGLSTGNPHFDNWFGWVSIQPTLRKIFGCSFLPDFDYGRGGRGWRDLWQDCLGLILSNPKQVRGVLISNFSGVRIDGSNATIVGKEKGEFIADRNNISRVWMDHGIWPLLALDLYINETGDTDIFFEETTYFRDHQLYRSKVYDTDWKASYGKNLRTFSGKIYKGTILEHLLIQALVQFFNVGSHNHVRLEGADWNDGLDMAKENGESVTFSCMYAYNLGLLAELIKKSKHPKIKIGKELKILLSKINYNNIKDKRTLLQEYFARTNKYISGKKAAIDACWLVSDLESKSSWMAAHIRKTEWLKEGFFNGYYNNDEERVEGLKKNNLRMSLASQVFPIMSGVATDEQIKMILKSIYRYLYDKRLKGYHLNTDFKKEQYNLGRAFSFVYGDKENGAFFNHMVVMLANALYKRGYPDEAWRCLDSIYKMASDTARSKIYPCLPEYFDADGRGMYSYLTGSASWFVLTLLSETFGIKARNGDLCIEPKLSPEHFKNSRQIRISRIFAGRNLEINFFKSGTASHSRLSMIKATLNSSALSVNDPAGIIIERKLIIGLPVGESNRINIFLV